MRRWTGRVALGAGVALATMLASGTGWSQNDQSMANGTQQSATGVIQMMPAKADLQKGLNAKKLKAGDRVTAKLDETVKLPNAPALKRNTVLVGHVDAVDASEHHSDSKITVTFNQAKLKNGTVVPVKVTVMQLTGPPEVGSGMGNPGGPPVELAPSAGGPGAMGQPGMAGTERAKQDETAEPASPSGAAPGGVTRQNGVPGVMLQSDIHQSTSATFMSRGRNVDVPGGTEMQLAIAYAAQNATGQ